MEKEERYLYGFRISARVKAWIERRRGHITSIAKELIKADGSLLTKLLENASPVQYYSYLITWPDALMAWAVYIKKPETGG